ncbi:hypothetical protein UlMin_011460 [Ulmus minor]
MKIIPPKFFNFLTFVSLVMLSFLIHVGEATPSYNQHACTNSSTGTPLTPNTTYYSNLNLLLSYLTSNSTLNSGFYQTTVKSGTPDPVTGLFLCRGDITTAVCRECVANASKEVLRRCPSQKRAIVWYDVCLIRYQDRSEFETTPGIVPSKSMNSSLSVTEAANFTQLLAGAMDFVANGAANSQSGKKFATKEDKFSTRTLYSLAQCTPDLPTAGCDRCLRAAIGFIPSCCDNKQGGAVLLPSCFVRYELFPFYNATTPTGTGALSPPSAGKGKSSSGTAIAIVVPICVATVVFCIGACLICRKAKKRNYYVRSDSVREAIATSETFQFSLDEIQTATDNFAGNNKIGEGGFGEVYKGTLPNRQNIAVKRLSGSSGQGAAEFKNEALLVAKLQHRNLVRLFGFCLEGEEKILVFEYVPNKSLDYFLFDPEKQNQLDWTRRYKIIAGIARGILYLHEDSRLRIIHRDLKASNILLDEDMNPKISDFGMAKVFMVDQTQGNTKRIVGTYGYMSPEYAMHGQFSVKSDVFSFGVLILEILSGKKNTSFYQSHGGGDLLSFVWEHWRKGTPLELLDPTIRHSCSRNEVIRCIHMGLLCVQENPTLRPTMVTIVLMLNSYSVTLPLPQQPAFFYRNKARTSSSSSTMEMESDQSTTKSIAWSVNEDSMITEVYPR